MLTLKQLSELPRGNIKVIDRAQMSGYPLRWSNIITIMHNGFGRNVRRSTAFPFGLCEGIPEFKPVEQAKPGHGGKRTGAGRKPLPYIEAKTRICLTLKNEWIEGLGGEEKVKKIITDYLSGLFDYRFFR